LFLAFPFFTDRLFGLLVCDGSFGLQGSNLRLQGQALLVGLLLLVLSFLLPQAFFLSVFRLLGETR
jgi:hypothetical protein